jgi:hypothetical protein
MTIFLELLKLSVVGLIAGLFSSFLANRDFRNRKWWELKVSTYQEAIEALSDLSYFYERNFNSEIGIINLSDENRQKLESYWEPAFRKVRKLADSGSFLFSEKVNLSLIEFISAENEKSYTYFEHLINRSESSKKCLVELIACAKDDLRIRKPIFYWLS